MSRNNKEMLISLLTYNSEKVIEKCLKSISNQSNKNFKCFVFDNGSKDNTLNLVKKFDWVTLVELNENTGYTGGHNFAFKYFQKNFPKHKYMMILNPDIFLPNNVFQGFYELFNYKETVLYTCPTLYEINGKNRLRSSKNISLPSFTFFGRDLKANEVRKKCIKVMFVSGSCFVINLDKYKYNYLFKDYFMYNDEIELSIRVLLDGWENLSTTRIAHKHFYQKEEVSKNVSYLLELNRLKFQTDTFNHLFVLINLPFYIISRFAIIFVYKPTSHFKICFKGIFDGIKYFAKNAFKINVASFKKTLHFLFIENRKYN